jgi:hypothetical protein
METWTSIPPPAARKIAKGVKEMGVVRNKNLEEIINWRDEMLVKLLKVVYEEEHEMNTNKPDPILFPFEKE